MINTLNKINSIHVSECDFDNVNDLVKEEYPHIFQSMKNTGYKCEYPSFEMFFEITHEGDVVGFYTLESIALNTFKHTINEVYIIPEHRGKGLFKNALFHLLAMPNLEVYARKPNYTFIQFLLNSDFAVEIGDNLVVSYIKFVVKAEDTLITKKTSDFYRIPPSNLKWTIYFSNNFDTDLCSVCHSDPFNIIAKYDNTIVFSKPTEEDLKKYNLKKKYKKFTGEYIYNLQYNRAINNENIDKYIKSIDDEIKESMSINHMIGNESTLNDDVIKTLLDNDLNVLKGFEIRKHLIRELKKNNITFKSMYLRFMYLLSHIDEVGKKVKLKKN